MITVSIILSLYTLAVVASVLTVAQSPSFESAVTIESVSRTRLIQAKEVEAVIPVDLALAHYFATPFEAHQIQRDVLHTYSL